MLQEWCVTAVHTSCAGLLSWLGNLVNTNYKKTNKRSLSLGPLCLINYPESFSQKYVMAVPRFALVVQKVCIDHRIIFNLVLVELYQICKLQHSFGEIRF